MAAQRIHMGLASAGHLSRMIVDEGLNSPGVDVLGGASAKTLRTLSKIRYRLASKQRYYFRDPQYDTPNLGKIRAHVGQAHVDAIICHDMTNFITFEAVREISANGNIPILFMLMDMAAFTGGCHYAWDCVGYQRECGNCPALRLASTRDRSFRNHKKKAGALAHMNACVVAGSTWLADQARSSSLFRNTPVEIVPLGVSPELFFPRDAASLRTKFGLSRNRDVVFFGARQFDDRRKGMTQMIAALESLATLMPVDRLPTLLIAGDGGSFDGLEAMGFPIRSLGLIGTQELAEAYVVASVFVSPSIEDSGPMMINEAVMSGTLVAGFQTGVLPDLVEPGVTGHYAEIGDTAALARAIFDILTWPKKRVEAGRARAREIGLTRCSPGAQAEGFARIASFMSGRAAIG